MKVIVKVDLTQEDTKTYWWNLGEAASQFLHALIGGNANLTLSSQTYYWYSQNKLRGKILIRIVDFIFGKGHCKNAWENFV